MHSTFWNVAFVRACLVCTLLAPVLAGNSFPEQTAGTKPNFLVILADDMGYSDAGCFGGEIKTPNLDQLAKNGLRFSAFYNTARCWPSRACLLTGYYAQQVRRDVLPGQKGSGQGKRPPWARLLPELLSPLGYRSYHSGKWHVDGAVLSGGFHRSYSLDDHDRFHNPRRHLLDDQALPPVSTNDGYYATTAIADHAIQMLNEHKNRFRSQPFFLYVAFTSPHFPLHALPEDLAEYENRYTSGWDALRLERYRRLKKLGVVKGGLPALDTSVVPAWNFPAEQLAREIGPGEAAHAVPWGMLTAEQQRFQPMKMALHAAMVHRMDIEIGRVLDRVREMGAWENTVVLFASDNGASAEQIIRGDRHDPGRPPGGAGTFLSLGPGWSSAANTPFRLHKSWVHEGGISTPFIVHWPAGIRARGQWRHTPGHFVDIPPTLLELAGGAWPAELDGRSVPPPPGKSLVPVFRKDRKEFHPSLWWAHDGNRAIRMGDWKLVADHRKPWELYNLAKDRGETQNLASDQPDRVARLEAAWLEQAESIRAMAESSP